MHFPKTLIKNRFYKHRQCYTNSPFPFALSRPSISHAVSVSVSKPSGYAHANHVLDPTLGCLHHSLGRATYRSRRNPIKVFDVVGIQADLSVSTGISQALLRLLNPHGRFRRQIHYTSLQCPTSHGHNTVQLC
jgi:hypothetical protein